jgi:hypothetical protein
LSSWLLVARKIITTSTSITANMMKIIADITVVKIFALSFDTVISRQNLDKDKGKM